MYLLGGIDNEIGGGGIIDIDKWRNCRKDKPKKKGKYMLIVGRKGVVGHWLETTMLICNWNGHVWDTPADHIPMQWKYAKTINGGV